MVAWQSSLLSHVSVRRWHPEPVHVSNAAAGSAWCPAAHQGLMRTTNLGSAHQEPARHAAVRWNLHAGRRPSAVRTFADCRSYTVQMPAAAAAPPAAALWRRSRLPAR
jgi:hypothetical protein